MYCYILWEDYSSVLLYTLKGLPFCTVITLEDYPDLVSYYTLLLAECIHFDQYWSVYIVARPNIYSGNRFLSSSSDVLPRACGWDPTQGAVSFRCKFCLFRQRFLLSVQTNRTLRYQQICSTKSQGPSSLHCFWTLPVGQSCLTLLFLDSVSGTKLSLLFLDSASGTKLSLLFFGLC